MHLPKLSRPIAIAVATTLTIATSLTIVTVATGFPIGSAKASATPAAAAGDAALDGALDQIMASPSLSGSMTGLQVLDGATGAVVYLEEMPASGSRPARTRS